MKNLSLICAVLALGVPAMASAQRGGGMGAGGVQRVQRMDVQRIDTGRALTPSRHDIDVRRGGALRGDTGTRIRRADPERYPNHQARRRWNAANPTAPDPSRGRPGR